MASIMNLSIVIPAYNEEIGIAGTIDGVVEVIKLLDIEYELIVVNDGSTDNTAKIVENKNIKIINHEENKGYGASLKTGVRYSQYENILIIDADGSYPAEHIPDLLESAMNYDMVVGARVAGNVKIPLIRKPAKLFINKLANYLAEKKIPDLNSGMRIIKKEIIQQFLKILPNGFSFTVTITLAMLTNDYQIKYIPINYNERKGKSKIRPIHDTLNFIQLIIRTVMYFNPLKIFVPLSFFFVIPGIGFLIRDILALNLAQSSILLIVTGALILSIGMLADLIHKKL